MNNVKNIKNKIDNLLYYKAFSITPGKLSPV